VSAGVSSTDFTAASPIASVGGSFCQLTANASSSRRQQVRCRTYSTPARAVK
jgi:hypothetical protein